MSFLVSNIFLTHSKAFSILALEVVVGDNSLYFTVLIFTVLEIKEDEPILIYL